MIIFEKKIVKYFFILFIAHFSFSQQQLDVFDIAKKGTIENAIEVLKTNPNAFNIVDKNGFSPLTLSCYYGNNKVATFLINKGIEINSNSKFGTPLMAAIVKGNNEIAKLLIEKNADINFEDENGITALIYAVQFSNKEMVSLLIQKKANKSHQDKKGKTAFEYAVFAGNEEIINILNN